MKSRCYMFFVRTVYKTFSLLIMISILSHPILSLPFLSLPVFSLPILSLVTSAKDYVEIVHKLMEFHPSNITNIIGGTSVPSHELTDYTEFGSFISYAVLTIKSFFIEILSFNWLRNIWSASREIIVPDIASAMISEISVLDGYFHNAFTFLETPLSYGKQNYSFYGLEKFTIGFINSFFLFLPTSAAHVIFFRRLVFQGIEGGYVAGIGIIAGNILWLTSIIFGWRFFVIPWLSLDLLRYLLGFVILIKFMWHASRDKRILTNFSKSKIFLVNFLLAFTEQTNLYPFVTNMSIGAESSILETFPVDNLAQFFFVHTAYIVGLLAGSISLLNLTCWLWENPVAKMFFWLKLNVYMPNFYKNLNYFFLYLTMLCTISSFPYFGLDYTLTNPLGLVSDDRIFNQKNRKTNQAEFPEISFLKAQASDRNARDSRGRHGRRERWKERLIKYRGMDTSLYNQGVYDLFTIEDLNYGFDKFWLRKRIRNHPSRFRMLLIKPQLLSLKKQLAKPRLLTNEGARVEVFRMIYELFYHPNFHAYVRPLPSAAKQGPLINKMALDPIQLSVPSLKNKVATNASRSATQPLKTNDSPYMSKKGEEASNSLNSLNFKGSRSKEANSLSCCPSGAALRKFVRKVNTRIKSSEILLNKNNVVSLNKPIYSKQLFSSMQVYEETLTKKERQILRYKTKTFWGGVKRGGAKQTQNNGAFEETLLQVNNAKTMLHPIKFYLQKEKGFRRKLKFYGSSVFRKLSIENNAPYFRIMMKRLFYYYKPTLRWTNTFKLAKNKQGHKVRKKRSRTPLKIDVLRTAPYKSTNAQKLLIGGPFEQSNKEPLVMPSQYTSKGLLEASQPVVGNLEKSEFIRSAALLMKEPTHNFRIAGKNSSRHRNLIFKQALFNWYYTPFNRILSKLDVDSFIRRQPNSHFLTKKDEQGLHLKRFLLADHYDTLRWYTYMQHYRSMKTKIGGTKSFASKFVYNQQFQGTLKKIRHLFAITPSLFSSPSDVLSKQGTDKGGASLFAPFARRGRVGVNSKDPLLQSSDSFDILKFDQPLYNEYSNTRKKSIINDSVTHEELLSPAPILKTRERGQNRDTVGNDFIAQSTSIAREYLRTTGPIRQKTIKNFLHKKNYKELTKFILPAPFVSEAALSVSTARSAANKEWVKSKSPPLFYPTVFQLKVAASPTSFAKNSSILKQSSSASFFNKEPLSEGRVAKSMRLRRNQGHALLMPFFKNAGRKKQSGFNSPPSGLRSRSPTTQIFEGASGCTANQLSTQTPLLQVTRGAKNLNIEQDLWFSLLKTYKKGLYDKEFISKFVERRTKKREKRQQKKEKELQNRLKRLQKWLAPNKFYNLLPSAKRGASKQALTTGLKNAIKESILSDSFDLTPKGHHASLPVGSSTDFQLTSPWDETEQTLAGFRRASFVENPSTFQRSSYIFKYSESRPSEGRVEKSNESQTLFDPLFDFPLSLNEPLKGERLHSPEGADKGKVKTAKGLLGTTFIKTKLLLKNNLRLRLRRLVDSLSTHRSSKKKNGFRLFNWSIYLNIAKAGRPKDELKIRKGAQASLGLRNVLDIIFLPKAGSFSKMRATEKIKKLQFQNRVRIRRDRMYKNRKGSRKRYTKEIKKAQNDLISASSVPNTAPKGVKFNRRISTSLPIQLRPLFRNNGERLISKFEESKSIIVDKTKVNKSNYPRLKRFSLSNNALHILEGPLFKNALLRKRGLLPSGNATVFNDGKNEGTLFLPGHPLIYIIGGTPAFGRKRESLLLTRKDEGQSQKSYALSTPRKPKVKREKKANNESNDSQKEVPFLYLNTLFKMGGRYEIKQKFRLRKTKNRRNQRFGRAHRGVEHPSNIASLERKSANMLAEKRLQILKQALGCEAHPENEGPNFIYRALTSDSQPPFNSLTTNRREFAFQQTSERHSNKVKPKKSKKLKWKKFKKSINSEKARKARKQSIDAVAIQRAGALTKQMKRIKYNLKLQRWLSSQKDAKQVVGVDAARFNKGSRTRPSHGTWQFEKDRQFKQLIAKLSKAEIFGFDFLTPSLIKKKRVQLGKGRFSTKVNASFRKPGETKIKSQEVLFFNKSVLRKSNSQLLTTFAGAAWHGQLASLGGGRFVEKSREDFGQKEEIIPNSNLITRLYVSIFASQKGNKTAAFNSLKASEGQGTGATFEGMKEGGEGSFEILHTLINPNLTQKLLVATNPLPCYVGWDESTRKFVVTNRLLSRREAGYSATLPGDFAFGGLKSLEGKIDFTNAPLQGMNAGTTLYSQVPFTTFDPDQLFSKGMDGFAPIGWRRFEFTHTILKTKALREWLNFQSKKNSLIGLGNGESKEIGTLKPLLTKIYRLKKRVINLKKRGDSAAQFSFGKQEHRDIKTANNYSRRLQRHYKRTRKLQNEKAPVFLMSGPLINEVLPVHYINVFNKQNRLSKDRYLKRRLRRGKKGVPKTIQEFNTFTKLRSSFVEPPYIYIKASSSGTQPQGIYDFTFRRRLKTRRKYHRKTAYPLKRGQGAEVRPRRHRFLTFDSPDKVKTSLALPQMRKRPTRRRSKKRFNNGGSKNQKIKTNSALNSRLRQLRRRVSRQVIKTVPRRRPRAGGFIWPGGGAYLRLEQTESPKLMLKSPESAVYPTGKEDKGSEPPRRGEPLLQKGPHKIDKRAILLDLYVQPRKYLLEKHNIKVIKKKLEKAQRTNQIKQRSYSG